MEDSRGIWIGLPDRTVKHVLKKGMFGCAYGSRWFCTDVRCSLS